MPDRHGTAHDGIYDLPLVVLVAAVVMGLGSVAAGLSRPVHDSRRDVALVNTPQGPAVGGPSLTTMGSTPGRSNLQLAGTSPTSRARSRSTVPNDLSSRGVRGDAPRAFLAHMAAVLYGSGQPLPADVGRLQSLVTIATPTTTTPP